MTTSEGKLGLQFFSPNDPGVCISGFDGDLCMVTFAGLLTDGRGPLNHELHLEVWGKDDRIGCEGEDSVVEVSRGSATMRIPDDWRS